MAESSHIPWFNGPDGKLRPGSNVPGAVEAADEHAQSINEAVKYFPPGDRLRFKASGLTATVVKLEDFGRRIYLRFDHNGQDTDVDLFELRRLAEKVE